MSSPASDTDLQSSHVSDDSLISQDAKAENKKSPLWRSLYVLTKAQSAVNVDTLSSVPIANNPRPLRMMVNDSGELFTFKFPVTLDTGLDLFALKKMCAQFEVCPLDVNATNLYPQEAIRCSSATMDMLNVLHGEVENTRNTLLPNPAMYLHNVPFWCRYTEAQNEQFSVILITDPLVQNIPDPSRSSVLHLKRGYIGKRDTMQSPSKAKAAVMAGGPPGGGGEGSSTAANRDDLLSALPDPLGQYAGLIMQHNLQNAVVVPPNPSKYASNLTSGDVTMFECQLKLWNIAPNRRDNAPQDDRNGSKWYQVMLKSMKLLPDTSITASTVNDSTSNKKGKCKATDDGDGSQARKRTSEDGDLDIEELEEMEVGDD
ncbi:uncharacterized protein HD556DRAFT_1304762 [Suillus plorans]|uniref:Uncharacterized protein n=1 Tax=Suillus plorans TaxID=116603 RepID=A0A9P7DQV2_9AGAM|nr:uncharacterized protein HD556DRAFT_1304762 [Suillus plorans]KAG1800746.1 hypothetical protein HD556DRAFT_1304762 [Suillus plorans]